MSNIATSNTTPDHKPNEHIPVSFSGLLTTLQDAATFYGVEIRGTYVDTNSKMSGAARAGSFYVKP